MLPILLFAWLELAATPQLPDPAVVRQVISHLGAFDFATRKEAARSLRRAAPATAVPALEEAVRRDADEYVRFRSFVLLSALDAVATSRVATDLIADRNDRLRTVIYQWFEHHPHPDVLGRLIEALPAETSEFVRPALTRAVAAHRDDRRVPPVLRPLVLKGEDLFRGAVIAALGDYGGRYAVDELTTVARQEGPLQDDAVTALGRIGDPGVAKLLGALQASAPREVQPTVSAALCLIGVDCTARVEYLVSVLKFSSATDAYQPLLRGAAHGLGMLASSGRGEAFDALVAAGVSARESARAPIALAVGTVALRSPAAVLDALRRQSSIAPLAELLRDAFDMLSEDFEEERFGMELRRALWAAPEGSRDRRAATELAEMLEF